MSNVEFHRSRQSGVCWLLCKLFWSESCSQLCAALIAFITSGTTKPGFITNRSAYPVHPRWLSSCYWDYYGPCHDNQNSIMAQSVIISDRDSAIPTAMCHSGIIHMHSVVQLASISDVVSCYTDVRVHGGGCPQIRHALWLFISHAGYRPEV